MCGCARTRARRRRMKQLELTQRHTIHRKIAMNQTVVRLSWYMEPRLIKVVRKVRNLVEKALTN